MLDDAVGVDVVDDGIRIGLGAGREDNDIEVLTQSFEYLLTVRPNFHEAVAHPALK